MWLSPSSVHDSISKSLGIPNLAFSKVLMLVMRFTLEVFDAIEAKDIKNTLPTLGLGIVREEAVGGAPWLRMRSSRVLDMSDSKRMG